MGRDCESSLRIIHEGVHQPTGTAEADEAEPIGAGVRVPRGAHFISREFMFLAMPFSAIASSKVFDPFLGARDLKWARGKSVCGLTDFDP